MISTSRGIDAIQPALGGGRCGDDECGRIVQRERSQRRHRKDGVRVAFALQLREIAAEQARHRKPAPVAADAGKDTVGQRMNADTGRW